MVLVRIFIGAMMVRMIGISIRGMVLNIRKGGMM